MIPKLQFDHSKDYQLDALNSTLSLFEGQIKLKDDFVDFIDGVHANELVISKNKILENLQHIQKQNGIDIVEKLHELNFSVEMETGTGKTYVYLRTIYELNKKYGFKKFIIVVPSIAIREGTKNNFLSIQKDFNIKFNRIPIRCQEYSSKNLSYVRDFARSNILEIMIITLDSFNKKDKNILNIEQYEKYFHGKKPIELLQKTKPIIILDEPQKMGSDNSQSSIESLHPLFTLGYSATHRTYQNLIYKLSPFDAYKKRLVKEIHVTAIHENVNSNNTFFELIELKTGKNFLPKAKLKIIKKSKDTFSEATILVKHDDDLFDKTGNNPQYKDMKIEAIYAQKGREEIKISNILKPIKLGEKHDGHTIEVQRKQIKETIINHFTTQTQVKAKNIKVLSLFFIDKVANYQNNGPLMKIFDEEFEKLKNDYDDFKKLSPEQVRGEYFSKKNTDDENAIKREAELFELIMSKKEKLLSFDESISFIFSHSALREGWDNPNVFNICTLNQSISPIRKRQEIGRGLRLPVNQKGEQVLDKQFALTVIANDSYSRYVQTLQSEYGEDNDSNSSPPIYNKKLSHDIIINKEFAQNKFFLELWNRISNKTKYFVEIDSKNLIKKCIDDINKNFDTDSSKIITETVSIVYDESSETIPTVGQILAGDHIDIKNNYPVKDIVSEIAEQTSLTRKTIIEILLGISNLKAIFKNPQSFTSSILERIKNISKQHSIDHIKYVKTGGAHGLFKFEDHESYSFSILDVQKHEKTIFNKIVYDSDFEKEFAIILDHDDRIKFYFKLPSFYKIPTPVGTYNPDWAIVSEKINPQGKIEQTCYFVVETKAKKDEHLNINESLKIECGRKHFLSLNPKNNDLIIKYEVVKTIEEFRNIQIKDCKKA
jgi:type III restriction enzyme